MPSLSALPGKIKRDKLARALGCLGFIISKKGGKGDHIKATCIKTQKVVILPSDLRKEVLYYVIKEVERYSDVAWDDILKKL